MDVSELRQIVEIFIQEADETLEQFEQCFLDLERAGPSDQLLDRIFRIAHNLKGSSAALGFTELAEFTHHFESLLLSLKKREIPVSADVVSLLLGGRDFISEHLECLRSGKKTPGAGEALTQAMQRARQPKPEPSPIELPRPPAAGDIWFVDDGLKAVLFDLPDTTQPEVGDFATTSAPAENPTTAGMEQTTAESREHRVDEESDPKNTSANIDIIQSAGNDPHLSAIQAEIARLTLLAAQVNQTSMLAAQVNHMQAPGADGNQTLTNAAEEESAAKSSTQNTDDMAAYIARAQATRSTMTELAPRASATNTSTDENKNQANDLSAQAPALNTQAPAHSASNTTDESVKVSLNRIDKLLNFVGELVILQSVLDEHRLEFQTPLLQKSVSQMSKIIREVQEISMGLRMVKLKPVFLKLQRIVRDTSRQLNKDVEGIFTGDDTEIDKTVLDKIGDPLVHLVRNALDHGLETSEERARSGKPLRGTIKVNAFQQSRAIVIEVRDDGRGLDIERIRAKAIERGLMSPSEKLSDESIRSFIFHPGFSTKAAVTDISGRGVGLDVVASNVEAMQGRIEIESVTGQGSCFRILLPLTVAVVDAFVVKLGRERFVIAKAQVAQSLQPHEMDVKIVHGQTEMLNLRGQTIPLFDLAHLLKRPPTHQRSTFDGIALVVQDEGKQPFAVVVDDIISQQQVVIKKLGSELQNYPGLSGAAILGDGKPAIILDLEELVSSHVGQRQNIRLTKAA